MISISVVTICLNAENTIRATLENIHSQSYKGFEHIVIDGGSSDATLSVLKEFPGISKLVSAPDKGISDAFNKASRLATGDVMIFMNAGDSFAASHTLESVAALLSKYGNVVDKIFYGNYLLEFDGRRILKEADVSKLEEESALCHQAVFVGRDIYRGMAYDTRLKVYMDYDYWLRARGEYQFVSLNMTVCNFAWGGMSSDPKRLWRNLCEFYLVQTLNIEKYRKPERIIRILGRFLVQRGKWMVRKVLGNKKMTAFKKVLGRPPM